ncbi:HlyD family secretion protein [Alkaliphilus peptidifermentans]|uniref:Multidrug efflux pump subunit AcrA (Membrane-fusion protein) n=1 Tax=Alkaliphilus peptidifermentans DSM 18978 TaxID=1120976 RepID=A0A1G5BLS1_9FIRM|nr:hypothetical protein [Alkaliphilus peptidifermentans]SCX90850.1 hypothetical protein SAMN03080606_00451 [Alkaliphilus peptidifermentans DSM 18978]
MIKSKVLSFSKKVLIEFFILVFIIGFFSKSFISYSLPQARSVLAFSGTFNESISIEGGLKYKDVYLVRLGSRVIVRDFFIEPGRRVSKGTPLFQINLDYGINDYQQQNGELQIKIERERNNLTRLHSTSFLIDESNIASLKRRIQQEEAELDRLNSLYQSGAIPLTDVEKKDNELLNLKENLMIEEIKMKEKALDVELQIKEGHNTIARLEAEILENERKNEFYANIGDDGIYYAEFDGIIVSRGQANKVIPIDETIMEIAVITEDTSVMRRDLIFSGLVPVEYADYFEIGKSVYIEILDLKESIRFRVTDVSYGDKDYVRVEGDFIDERISRIVPLRNYKGVVKKQNYGSNVVPKSAVITTNFKPGEVGKVFLVETTEGILGKQHTAREVEITIDEVGDQRVSIIGLEGYENPRVITNLSYKIRDGVKVFHGN